MVFLFSITAFLSVLIFVVSTLDHTESHPVVTGCDIIEHLLHPAWELRIHGGLAECSPGRKWGANSTNTNIAFGSSAAI